MARGSRGIVDLNAKSFWLVLRLASEFRSVTMVIWCPEPGSNELFLPKVNYSHVPFTPTRSIIEKSCENAFTACPGWQIDDVRL